MVNTETPRMKITVIRTLLQTSQQRTSLNLVYTLYRKSPLKEDNLSTKYKIGWSRKVSLFKRFHWNAFTVTTILLQIHFNLAEYHEIGRFSLDHLTDVKCCLYHLSKSAQCGNVGAIYMLARIYLQRSHEKFLDVKVKVRV